MPVFGQIKNATYMKIPVIEPRGCFYMPVLGQIKKTITIHDNAALGLTHIDLTITDTTQSIDKYTAFFTLVDATGGRITYSEAEFQIKASER